MTTSLYPGTYPAELTIDSRMDAAGVTLAIGGEIDLASAPALKDPRAPRPPRRIVLDLEDLDFIDSAGVAGCSKRLIARQRWATD